MIRRDGASFEEWKAAEGLEELTIRMPERYQRQAGGGWRCPPGEQAASTLGLTYQVRTSGEYHPQYIQNLKFLQNFWTHPFSFSPQAERQVWNALAVYSGISVDALLEAHPSLVVDVVWAMLTTQSIFTKESSGKKGGSFESKREQTSSKKLLQLLPLFSCDP